MKYGLDFGTSNSVISYNDGNTVKVLPIEPTNGAKEIMPSLWYFHYDEEFWSFGKSAYDQYKESLGEGRLIQSLKKYLSDPTLRNTYVHKRTVEFDELVMLYLKEVKDKADLLTGENVKDVTIGKPVNFTESGKNELALKRIESGARRAGFENISFMFEPLAATYSLKQEIPDEANIFTLDIGGGTTDISIVRVSTDEERNEVLTTQGINIGGVDFDGRIVRYRILKHFGDGLSYDAAKTESGEFPRPLLFPLTDRYKIFTLANSRKYRADLDRASYGLIDPEGKTKALDYLIHEQVGLEMFDAIELAKKELSQTDSTTISYHKGPINIEEPLSRKEFEEYIKDYTRKISNLVVTSLSAADLEPEDIDKILLVGGSSKIPVFRNLIAEFFPDAEILRVNEMTSIAHGLGCTP